ncbi:DUF4006 family protein [Helicobacter sp. MIT 99-5507]|uniref:DUF4006 family protein n=1 Tax=Helicobacter sp. MIT 99-5507 TaxID=152489 RepID=UPI000E1EEBFF|nr:DUF4006 family protein [Helicobacter sp. MIT 99-5507]RDU58172.1 DUF4006 domain-containing protein [Helicobacter sp. MIT 99-5507]
MNGGYFSLNGLTGFIIAVVLLLAIVVVLGVCAVNVQKKEATNYYNLDATNIEMVNNSNAQHYQLKKE